VSRLVRLYPAAWRERYEAEFLDLLAARPPSARDRVDILAAALDAWLHPQVTRAAGDDERRAVIGPLVTRFLAVVGGLLWIAGGVAFFYLSADRSVETLDSTVALLLVAAGAVVTGIAAFGVAGSRGPGRSDLRIAALAIVVTGALIVTPWPFLALGFYGFVTATSIFGLLLVGSGRGSVALVGTALALVFFNTENAQALATIPFGLTWTAMGLLAGRRAPAAKPSAKPA
jgi:hypothetical protein